VIVLRSPDLLVRLDPGHGGEILDLVELRTGRQLLGRPSFASTAPVGGDLDEAEWTAAYRGGWQVLLPNAGSECTVDGRDHGFHGRASNDPWFVEELEEGSATLAWTGHGLRAERRLALRDGGLAVSVGVTAGSERAPLIAAEHVALGLELLEPEVELELPGGRAFELDEAAGPPEPPADAAAWPEVRLLDGSSERADRWPLERERSRLYCVSDLPSGRAAVRNAAHGHGLELTWDVEWFRHAWIWHEVRTYGGPWRGQTELIAIEPASVPHPLGLATAVQRGQARWLEPGASFEYELFAHPLPAGEDSGP
jgi:hypothetical protein